ncbi:hypothetical protein ACH4FA_13960 [Streptomyces sp. NPDC017966]|uniref:hypothetical protein n=1 Tax=unclassified Streptomyces TaxID=2593676 RepID=UPI0020B67729|nr:hypothetical protein [Streptomyces sp. AC558_RSS880]
MSRTPLPRERSEGDLHVPFIDRGVIQLNLNWSVTAEAALGLGCLVLTRDGAGTAVQPLGA